MSERKSYTFWGLDDITKAQAHLNKYATDLGRDPYLPESWYDVKVNDIRDQPVFALPLPVSFLFIFTQKKERGTGYLCGTPLLPSSSPFRSLFIPLYYFFTKTFRLYSFRYSLLYFLFCFPKEKVLLCLFCFSGARRHQKHLGKTFKFITSCLSQYWHFYLFYFIISEALKAFDVNGIHRH